MSLEKKENNKEQSGKDPERTPDKDFLFPYENMREIQAEMVKDVAKAISGRRSMIIHAPTGLGKTAATLAPALAYALKNKKKIFFLTSRHTQHTIAIETLREIQKRHDQKIICVDIIGKKWMCPAEGVEKLYSNEFAEYCKKQRENNTCYFFNRTKKSSKLTAEGSMAYEKAKEVPMHIEEFTKMCKQDEICAYEIAATLAKEANVVVADYYYMFNPKIRDGFLKRAQIDLSDCIVIVDEAHNLPDRIRNLMTTQVTNNVIRRALKEAKKIERAEIVSKVSKVQDALNTLSTGMKTGDEKYIGRELFMEEIEDIGKYEELAMELELTATTIRETEKQSSLGTIAAFLFSWQEEEKGYARILSVKESHKEQITSLTYRCLDASTVSKDVINSCHSIILMSGTLQPTSMYRDLLGFDEDVIEKSYASPFPNKNRLNLIIPETTTKFAMRNPDQYRRIAEITAEITNTVPGNCAIFFPSYYIRDEVYKDFHQLSRKTAFPEMSEMTKEDKTEFLDKFKSYRKAGAVLLGAVTGSFGEGIDLPGDLLNCVVVVGLPLQKPDLEINSLIKYYDLKFAKGWEYGYVNPAFQKTMQNAGRCIRSETDRGVIVFLDERYAWQNYYQNFPKEWDIVVTKDYVKKIKEFYG